MKNFNLRLPERIYEQLTAEAASCKVPATAPSREAIDLCVRNQMRAARHDGIARYAKEMAGTNLDLDPDLESAAIEDLLTTVPTSMTNPAVRLPWLEGEHKLESGETMDQYVEQRDGGYYVTGTRISLDSVVLLFKNGASPESILRSFPLLRSLENVYGAITFYLANKEAVEAYLHDQERLSQELAARQSPLPESLSKKLRFAKEEVPPRQS